MAARTTLRQRILLLGLGLVASLLVVECTLQLGALGLRIGRTGSGTDEVGVAKSGEYTVLCLGESTTAAFMGVPSYTGPLSRELNARGYGRSFRVVNAGYPSVSTSVLLEKLPELIEEHQPDMAVIMMGVNDAFYFSQWDRLGVSTELQQLLLKSRTYKLTRLLAQRLDRGGADRPPAIDAEDLSRYRAIGRRVERAVLAGGSSRAGQLDRDLHDLIDGAREAAGAAGGEVPEPYRFYYRGALMVLQERLRSGGRPEEAIELLETAIAEGTDDTALRDALVTLYREVGRDDRAEEHQRALDALVNDSVLRMTRRNYRAAVEMLRERGVRVVAMQYPMRSSLVLRRILDDRSDVTYVDGEYFQELVAEKGYRAIFRDRFAGDFGHLQPRGNRILAAHLVHEVFDPLFAAPD